MKTGIKDVARLAGVSVGTVSNFLNRPQTVSEATRARVEAAVSELGFVRNESARQLRVGRSRTLALVVMDIANPFFADVARGAERAAETAGALVVVSNSAQDPVRERRHLRALEEQRVMGVLLSPTGDDASVGVEPLRRRGIAVVLVDRAAAGGDQCSVTVDDDLGGRLAGEHLVEQGNRRLAFVGGPVHLNQVQQRLQGFSSILRDAGIDSELDVVETDGLSVDAGMPGLTPLLSRPARQRPTGLFCANDLIALQALRECTRLGLRVPADVAIVGYDDIAFAASAAVPLTSVRQPREQLGTTGVELLLAEVAEGSQHQHRSVLFQPELIVRESSVRREA